MKNNLTNNDNKNIIIRSLYNDPDNPDQVIINEYVNYQDFIDKTLGESCSWAWIKITNDNYYDFFGIYFNTPNEIISIDSYEALIAKEFIIEYGYCIALSRGDFGGNLTIYSPSDIQYNEFEFAQEYLGSITDGLSIYVFDENTDITKEQMIDLLPEITQFKI